jgi:hypothetical protein
MAVIGRDSFPHGAPRSANAMPTNVDDDPDLDIPEFDWGRAVRTRTRRLPGERREVRIDGAVGYALRLIPSNKVLCRFTSTLEAWPAIIAAVDEAGRSPRTLALDWIAADGRSERISAGPFLVVWARVNNGGPHPYADHDPARKPHTLRRRA